MKIILIFSLIVLTSCQQIKSEDKTSDQSTDQETQLQDVNWDKKFKYRHIERFTPRIFKDDSLVLIDSLFHYGIISQIEGYTSPFSDNPKNYFISRQHTINGLTALTVSLYWGICYEGITLLILDKQNKLLNAIALTEWYSSCDFSTNTETTFLTDSTFLQHKTVTEPGETDSVTEIEFKGLINSAGQIDTLDILMNKKYEQ